MRKRNERLKRTVAMMATALMFSNTVSMPVLAATATQSVQTEAVEMSVASETELPDNDELFWYFVEQKLYGYEMATFGTKARERLNDIEKKIYDELKTKIETVANEGGSTVFELDLASMGIKNQWTKEELGVENIDLFTAMKAAALLDAQFNIENIVYALLNDCPFDLYWYDKVNGGVNPIYEANIGSETIDGTDICNTVTFEECKITFTVAQEYKDENGEVTKAVSTISGIKEEANRIVSENASKSDYEKLVAYKEYICNAVSYNTEATEGTPYGNPWQLIYVFDKDSNTNVVCEGYAKAFQYLCDLGGLECISVSGTMEDGTDPGEHMWNIVVLDGKSYLVDVTNCDGDDNNSIGYLDSLFLKGYTSNSADSYTFNIKGIDVTFTYDEKTKSLYEDSKLTLSERDYTPPQSYQITISESENGTVTVSESTALEGSTVDLTVTPEEGYELESLKVVDSASQNIEVTDNQFIMPAGNVTITATFVKEKVAIQENMITLSAEEMIYNGQEQIPNITVQYEGKVLTRDDDYMVTSSEDMTNVGQKNITIIGQGDYSGEIKKVVNIVAKEVTVSDVKVFEKPYDGSNEVDVKSIEISGVVNYDAVFVDLTKLKVTLESADAGTYEEVNLSNIVLEGEKAGNYTVKPIEKFKTKVIVNKANVEILMNQNTYNKVYGDSEFNLGITTNIQEAEVQYTVTSGTDVVSVSDGTITILKAGEATVTVSVPENNNYSAKSTSISIKVDKAESPKIVPASSMLVSNVCTKVGEVTNLPNGWAWAEAGKEMELEVGEVVNATAEYIGEDKDNYKNVTMTVAITRSNCDHKESDVICDKTVVETDEEPTCEESGMGHTICTKEDCGEIISNAVEIPELGHKYKSEITKPATTKESGIRTYTCEREGCNDSYEETIPKKSSSSSSSSSSTPTTQAPTTEEPTTEEPTTEEPSTEEPTTEEPTTEEPSTQKPNTEKPDTGESATVEWKSDEKGVYYEKEDGTRADGWLKLNDEWYFFDKEGYRETDWVKDNGTWYYLNENGGMETGWLKDEGKWYYLDKSGAMQTDWVKDGNTWYYLNTDGSMKTGWLKDGDSWYYLNTNGSMKTGWLKDKETWYYLNTNGSMKTGWIQLGADWFYLNDSGAMAADTYIGIWYVDENGYYIPSKDKKN